MGKGLDKFTAEIDNEVNKVKEQTKKQYYRQMMDELIKHIKSVCDDEYDCLMAQNHKTFVRSWKFITEKARKMAVNNCAFVADSTVFGWFDEYLGTDDKAEAETELKAKTAADSKSIARPTAKKPTKSAIPTKATQDVLDLGLDDEDEAEEVEAVEEKAVSKGEQLSIFDLM